MSNELPPDEEESLLKFIASTVERNQERLDSLSEGFDSLAVGFDSLSMRFDSLSQSVATKDELRTQTTAIRGDIEQVQLRLDSIERTLNTRMGQIEADLSRLRSAVYLLSKERPEVLRLLGQ
jgi:chromosome segregation ATPase